MDDLARLIVVTRRRMRVQAALDGGMLALGSAVMIAASAVVLVELGTIGIATFAVVLAIAGTAVAIGCVARALRPIPELAVAHQIDLVCGPGDRVRTALELAPQLATAPASLTGDFMRAAVRDGIAAAARVTARRAAPLRWPQETRFAAGIVVFAIAITLPTTDVPVRPRPPAIGQTLWLTADPPPDVAFDPRPGDRGSPPVVPVASTPRLPLAALPPHHEVVTPPAQNVSTELAIAGLLPATATAAVGDPAQRGKAHAPERTRSAGNTTVLEDVVHGEHVPAAYRAYLKRYFQKLDDFAFPE